MTKQIPLTQGKVAVVCDCCAHKVIGEKWYAVYHSGTRSFYAARNSKYLFGKQKTVKMHRVINGTPAGMQTDHINRDTLDNRCSNLRTVTHSQNQMNKGRQSNNTSGFKGVSWDKTNLRWVSYIQVSGIKKTLGYFKSPEEAARSYDEAAKELHGEFAVTNF